MPSKHETCRCLAYKFPHREGGGKCHAKHDGPYCGSCGAPSQPVQRDFGIGAYECHGHRGIDRNIHTVSDCCNAPLYTDASLTIDYEHDE